MMAGQKRPSTSKTPAAPEAMERFVMLEELDTGSGMVMWSVSWSTSQWMPKALGAWLGGVIETVESASSRSDGIRAFSSLELVLYLRRVMPALENKSQSSV